MSDMKIHAVLLVPEPNDPHGLLREGPCGARPPMVVRVGDRWYNPWVRPTDPYVVYRLTEWACDESALPTALVLAWDGEPVAGGLDRLARMGSLVGGGWRPLDPNKPRDLHNIVRWARALGRSPAVYGTIVLPDAEKREVGE